MGILSDLSKSDEEIQRLNKSTKRSENYSGDLPMKNIVSNVDFDKIQNYLNEAQAPIGAVFAKTDNMGALTKAHQTLITGAYTMGGKLYVSYYDSDPSHQTQNVKEYKDYVNYGEGRTLKQIGIIDESKF